MRTRGLSVIVLVVVLAAASACVGNGRDERPQPSAAETPAQGKALKSQASPDALHRWKPMLAMSEGRVFAYTTAYLDVDEDLTVRSIEAVPASNVEVLATRLTYMYRAVDKVRIGSSIGGACFDEWPPSGYGPSFEAAGSVLRKGDQVTVLAYVRPKAVGPWGVQGVRVTYEQAANRAHEQEFDNVAVEGAAVATKAELGDRPACDTIVPTWSTPPTAQNVCLTRHDTPCAVARN